MKFICKSARVKADIKSILSPWTENGAEREMNILRFIIPKSLVVYIDSKSTVRQALEKMRFHRYIALPVLNEEGVYVGTVRNDDIYKYFIDNETFDSRSAEKDSVISILDPTYSKPLYHNATMNDLIDNVKEHNQVAVVDDRGCFIGIILRRDVLNFLFKFYEDEMKKRSDGETQIQP